MSNPESLTVAETAPTQDPVKPDGGDAPRATSLTGDAFRSMFKRPLFWITAGVLLLFVVMAIVPELFTSKNPNECSLLRTKQLPSSEAIFGYDVRGCDVYARTIHGARASILVGILTSIGVLSIGVTLGAIAGYYRSFADMLISRLGEIFAGIPVLLAGLLVLVSFPTTPQTPYFITILKVVIALALFGWPGLMRMMRSTVLQVAQMDYVQSARALGASGWRMMLKHVIPNAIGPVIVIATINLGVYIAAEATLSFLGIGLQGNVVSWGIMISDSQSYMRVAPHMMLFPAGALSLCVFSFIVLGDIVRDAFDPKSR